MMCQTNDVKYFQVNPALGPAALPLGRPGALPAGLVQPCPNPRALFHKYCLGIFVIFVKSIMSYVSCPATSCSVIDKRDECKANMIPYLRKGY